MLYSNSPILITIPPVALPSSATNALIVLTLTFNTGRQHTFRIPATYGNNPITYDISSAYRAELILLDLQSNDAVFGINPSSPTTQVTSHHATIKYLLEGNLEEKSIAITIPTDTARRGKLTDIEYRQHQTTPLTRLSTKPQASPETYNLGDEARLGSQTTTITPVLAHSLASPSSIFLTSSPLSPSPTTTTPSSTTALITNDPNRHLFYFLNRRGEIESISICTHTSLQSQIKTETYDLYRTPGSTSPLQRALHTPSPDQWTFTTGILTRDWYQWFAHDFLVSSHHWLKTQQGIIPVTITPTEKLTIYDRTAADIKSISFQVSPSLTGDFTL